jgi:predicted permease
MLTAVLSYCSFVSLFPLPLIARPVRYQGDVDVTLGLLVGGAALGPLSAPGSSRIALAGLAWLTGLLLAA